MALTERVLPQEKNIFIDLEVIATWDSVVPRRLRVLATYLRLTGVTAHRRIAQ